MNLSFQSPVTPPKHMSNASSSSSVSSIAHPEQQEQQAQEEQLKSPPSSMVERLKELRRAKIEEQKRKEG